MMGLIVKEHTYYCLQSHKRITFSSVSLPKINLYIIFGQNHHAVVAGVSLNHKIQWVHWSSGLHY